MHRIDIMSMVGSAVPAPLRSSGDGEQRFGRVARSGT